jgi:Family of unknown function (DUF5682)
MDGLHLLGIRHHGPGSARSVVRALDDLRPDVVLVEAPAEATAALRWVGDPGLVPPVALLGHVVDHPHLAVFAPLASFSPEWQAVAWANAHDVPVRAIDLPLAVSLAGGDTDVALFVDDGPAPPDPIAELAAAAGDPDAERWWEDVVEHRGDGVPAFDAVASAMAAVREGTATSTAEARREAHMRQAIRSTLRDGPGSVVVVCGAWHVPALDPSTVAASADAALLRGLPKVKVAVSWVPWTHQRLAASTGYGAGVRSPGWYDHVFRHPGRDAVARFFVDAATLLREADIAASPEHLIAATRTADTLAVLRGRPRPGLEEVLDAADAVMGGLPLVRRRLVVGEAIGEVPEHAPQVPLARDLAARQRAVRLKPAPASKIVELDLRTPRGLARSHVLHRVAALGIGWGALEAGRGTSGTFRETWRLSWEPEMSVRVVELAGLGTTVEQAATRRLVERAAAATGLLELADTLDRALLAALPGAIGPVVATLSARAANDPDLGQVMASLGPLAHAQRYGDVRATDVAALRTVFDGLVARVIAGAVAACSSLDDGAAAEMVERLTGVQAALALLDHPARHRELPDVLARLAEARVHGLVQGGATRLLHDAGSWDAGRVERRLSRALSGGTPPAGGAAFVEGFLAGSGTVLVHDADLRGVVDRWLASLTPDAFVETAPLLRRTFGAFEPAERRRLGQLVAGAPLEPIARFGESGDNARVAAALRTVRLMLGLPVSHDVASGGSPHAAGEVAGART